MTRKAKQKNSALRIAPPIEGKEAPGQPDPTPVTPSQIDPMINCYIPSTGSYCLISQCDTPELGLASGDRLWCELGIPQGGDLIAFSCWQADEQKYVIGVARFINREGTQIVITRGVGEFRVSPLTITIVTLVEFNKEQSRQCYALVTRRSQLAQMEVGR